MKVPIKEMKNLTSEQRAEGEWFALGYDGFHRYMDDLYWFVRI